MSNYLYSLHCRSSCLRLQLSAFISSRTEHIVLNLTHIAYVYGPDTCMRCAICLFRINWGQSQQLPSFKFFECFLDIGLLSRLFDDLILLIKLLRHFYYDLFHLS